MENIVENSNILMSNVFDINGKNIKLGDKIKFWIFYNQKMNSDDCFGTDPQNSFTVYEEYMDFVEGEVIFDLGAFCVKYGKEIKSLRDVINKTPLDFEEYYMLGYGGEPDFDDDDFWGSCFSEKLEQFDYDSEKYWEIIRSHLQLKCKEFEVVTGQN